MFVVVETLCKANLSQTSTTTLGFTEEEKRRQKLASDIFVAGSPRKPARPVRGTGQAGSTQAAGKPARPVHQVPAAQKFTNCALLFQKGPNLALGNQMKIRTRGSS